MAMLGLLAACGSSGEVAGGVPTEPSPVSTTSVTVEIEPEPAEDRSTIAIDGEPGRGVVVGGTVWVPGRGVLHVVDVETRTVIDEIVVGAFPQRPLEVDGSVWVANRGDGTVSVVDVEARTVTETISLGGEFLDDAIDVDGQVWVRSRDAVYVIDPLDRSVVATIDVGLAPSYPVASAGRVWIASFDEGTVTAIDQETLEVVDRIMVGGSALTPAVDDSAVYVLSDDGLTKIDIVTGSTLVSEASLPEAYPPVLVDGDLWVLGFTISVVDVETLEVIDELDLDANDTVVVHEGLAWLVDTIRGELVGVDTATRDVEVSAPVGAGASAPFVSDDLVWVANSETGSLTVIEMPAS